MSDLVGQHDVTRDYLDTLPAPARAVPRLAEIIDRVLEGGTASAQEA